MAPPANGTIWERLDAHGISWNDYAWDLPDILLVPSVWQANQDRVKTFDQFLTDCRDGSLPQVSIVSPGVTAYSEENPADIQLGEAYSASIDQRGDAEPVLVEHRAAVHVRRARRLLRPRPAAGGVRRPTTSRPIPRSPSSPATSNATGLRVPAFVISPFAKPHHVSHVVHDHTSVLKLIETKFNLGRADLPGRQRVEPARLASICIATTDRRSSTRPSSPRPACRRPAARARPRRRHRPSRPPARRPATPGPCRPGSARRCTRLPAADDPSLSDTQAERVKLLDAVTARPDPTTARRIGRGRLSRPWPGGPRRARRGSPRW